MPSTSFAANTGQRLGKPWRSLEPWRYLAAAAVVLAALLCPVTDARAETAGMCLQCHGEPGVAKTTRTDSKSKLFVDSQAFRASSHGRLKCEDCHVNAYGDHRAVVKRLPPVDCTGCHKDQATLYQESVHGKAKARKDPFAPSCHHCHGKHDILPSSNPKSHTYIMNVPSACSACHREGAPMMQVHDIAQRDAVSHYSMSDHAKGIFKRGLIVSAVCTSCHGSHEIFNHKDPRSSINQQNVAKVCMKCHAQIERVHTKVIRGTLWEKEAGKIPNCIDCHPPHLVRRVFYESDLPDKVCLDCHQGKHLTKERDGKTVSLDVQPAELGTSVHGKLPCVKCHIQATARHKRPCQEVKKVDCSICHAESVRDFDRSTHGTFAARGDANAPTCIVCHGTHGVQSKKALDSPTFGRNVPELCGRCHQEGQKAAVRYTGTQHDIINTYTDSTHGKGLLKSGLLVTAKCTDCHSAHRILPSADPQSTVHRSNLAETCAKCHLGILEQLKASVHGPAMAKAGKQQPPICVDCHSPHGVSRVEQEGFRQGIFRSCGKCHEKVAATYFDTFHGKASLLGAAKAAKCHDCHGAHNVLPITNPKSTLSFWNIVNTCSKCHPNSNRKFTGYLTHATHHDREKYPFLFYTFWFMTILLISTLSFFGLHNLLWLRHSFPELWRRLRTRKQHPPEEVFYMRFTPFERFLHILVIVSFLGLALTGMTLKFPDFSFFSYMSASLGGVVITGFIHRLCAVITFAYFVMHLWHMVRKLRTKQLGLKEMFVGENSLMPGKRDLIEFGQTMKWFVGLGPRPKYGRWTYWEKFDYLAVFWGVAIIGFTGLILWFPETFTLVLPGWIINVATVIHSDEALLATGFIFTIHFFNTHMRPESFPMDPVIFTGRVSLEELKEQRPREYAWLVENGKLEGRLTGPAPKWLSRLAYIGGMSFLSIGIMIVVAIIWAMLAHYA